MKLVRSSILNGLAVAVKTSAALLINKVLAVYVGPGGYVVVGQLQNIVGISVQLSTGGILNGVIKLLADPSTQRQRDSIIATALRVVCASSIVTALALGCLKDYLAATFLTGPEFSRYLLVFTVLLPACAINSLLLAVLNGTRDISRYVVANICGSVLTMLLTASLVMQLKLPGALLALCINQAIALLATFAVSRSAGWLNVSIIRAKFDAALSARLGSFAIMTFTSSLAAPLAQILVRQHLTNTLGVEQAGYWQALWKASEVYLLLITSTLSVYYLPRFSELTSSPQVQKELRQAALVLGPALVLLLLGVFITRHYWIATLFSTTFLPLADLVVWQITGDFLKMCGWLLGYLMLSKAMVRPFVTTEVLFAFLFFFLTASLVPFYGVKAAPIAHSINYAIYVITLLSILRRARVL